MPANDMPLKKEGNSFGKEIAFYVKLKRRDGVMLYWALVFLIIAIVAAVFGFGGVAGTASAIAQVLFFLFLVIFLITLVSGLVVGRKR
jgi:uncharacterized membrane protein YtjA (UPF0391 family)